MQDISIFDIIGPVMIGPSSSHTAGAVRIGQVAGRLFNNEGIKKATFYMHGSFAKTYKGHGTDKALLAGLMGFGVDDERIPKADVIAKERNIEYAFIEKDLGMVHPNTVLIDLTGVCGNKLSIMGSSIGGGRIEITQVNGFKLKFNAENPTIIIMHVDKPGAIAHVATVLKDHDINIGYMEVFRQKKGSTAAMVIEVDSSISDDVINEIKDFEYIKSVRTL